METDQASKVAKAKKLAMELCQQASVGATAEQRAALGEKLDFICRALDGALLCPSGPGL